MLTANLTMDKETGIGNWSEADFVKTLRTGFRPDGHLLRFPMLTFAELDDAELAAVFAYLKTVPVIKNSVPRNFEQFTSPAGTSSEGQKLYQKYGCFACHGENGVGVCDLREASHKYDSDEKLMAFLKNPSQFVPNTKMPTWNGVIADAEFPPLLAYVHELEQRPHSAVDEIKH